jgi:hypothetical protein
VGGEGLSSWNPSLDLGPDGTSFAGQQVPLLDSDSEEVGL